MVKPKAEATAAVAPLREFLLLILFSASSAASSLYAAPPLCSSSPVGCCFASVSRSGLDPRVPRLRFPSSSPSPPSSSTAIVRPASVGGGDDGGPLLPWMRPPSSEKGHWFHDVQSGTVPFSCTGCGDCCRSRGDVYLDPKETRAAAKLLGMSVVEFKGAYAAEEEVIPLDAHDGEEEDERTGWITLKQKTSDGSCIFLDDNTNFCGIYEARPAQCSSYPFWPRVCSTREDWNGEVRIGRDEEEEEGAGRIRWTMEGGGCEGMRKVDAEGRVAEDDGEGVPVEEAEFRLRMQERYQRTFPATSEFRLVN